MIVVKTNKEINFGEYVAKSRIDGKPMYRLDEHALKQVIRLNEFNFSKDDEIKMELVSSLEDWQGTLISKIKNTKAFVEQLLFDLTEKEIVL